MRNQIILQQAILAPNDRVFKDNNRLPSVDVTQQVIELFMNPAKTEIYIPKHAAAKTLLLLHHYKESKSIAKPLEFVNNRYFKNMGDVVLQIILYYADARVQVDIHGHESFYLYTMNDIELGCRLQFEYGRILTPRDPTNTQQEFEQENTSPVIVKNVTDNLNQQIYESRIRDTVIQRVCVNNVDDITSLFPKNTTNTRMKCKFKVNDLYQRVEVLAPDESLSVVTICDMGAANSQLNEQVALANIKPIAPLIQIQKATFTVGSDVRDVTEQIRDLVSYNTLVIPSAEKSYFLEMFFPIIPPNYTHKPISGILEVTYMLNGKVITLAVTEREGLVVIASDVVEENDRLIVASAGKFTQHMMTDYYDNIRKRLVNNCIYLRQSQSGNIFNILKTSIAKMSESLQYYIYANMRYGDAQVFWICEQNDGVKIVAHRANSVTEEIAPIYANEIDRTEFSGPPKLVTVPTATVRQEVIQQPAAVPSESDIRTDTVTSSLGSPLQSVPPPIMSDPEKMRPFETEPPVTEEIVIEESPEAKRSVPPPVSDKEEILAANLATVIDEPPPTVALLQNPNQPSGVILESRIMQTMDSISIQLFSKRISLADLVIKSDIYVVIILALWVFFIVTDPALYRWFAALYTVSRVTVDFLGHVLMDSAIAVFIFSIIYLTKNPELIPNFLNAMKNTQTEVEKVQVAKESLLGKMFDFYVWTLKKTQRKRPVTVTDTQLEKAEKIAQEPLQASFA
jgi:hypothetical protein